MAKNEKEACLQMRYERQGEAERWLYIGHIPGRKKPVLCDTTQNKFTAVMTPLATFKDEESAAFVADILHKMLTSLGVTEGREP